MRRKSKDKTVTPDKPSFYSFADPLPTLALLARGGGSKMWVSFIFAPGFGSVEGLIGPWKLDFLICGIGGWSPWLAADITAPILARRDGDFIGRIPPGRDEVVGEVGVVVSDSRWER